MTLFDWKGGERVNHLSPDFFIYAEPLSFIVNRLRLHPNWAESSFDSVLHQVQSRALLILQFHYPRTSCVVI